MARRLVYGSYGHNPSGKQYVYWGSENLRTGQSVVAPVTNHGKTYNTMFTIQRTSNETSPMAQREANSLEGEGIFIKTIGGRDVLSLPGGREWKTAKEWKEWSDMVRQDTISRRLKSYSIPRPNNTRARNQLLSY